MVRRKWWQPRRTAVAGARPSVLLESIPPHIQNWPFIFSDLRMPLLPGCPTTRLQCLWIGKRHRDEPVRRRFQGTVSTLSCVNSSLSTCDRLAHHFRLDSEQLYHRDLVAQKETWRGQTHQQASCWLPVLLQNSVFWLVGMLRSTVCHASYSEAQRAGWADHQVIPTFSFLIVNCR